MKTNKNNKTDKTNKTGKTYGWFYWFYWFYQIAIKQIENYLLGIKRVPSFIPSNEVMNYEII